MKVNSILCDSCNEELIIDSQYPHNFVLELNVVDTGINTKGSVYCVHQEPIFKESKHFCDIKCLTKWITNETN